MKLLQLLSLVALAALSRADECPAPSSPEYTRYCQLSLDGEVWMRELTADEHAIESLVHNLFEPNQLHPSEHGVFYDCECAPKCGVDEVDRYYNPIYQFAQIGLDNSYFSYFHDDTFHYCIAVPKRAQDTQLYFQDANGEEIPAFNCPSVNGLDYDEDCYGWRKVETGYRHHCYDTYCVDAPWEQLTPYYSQHTDEYYTVTYNGVVCSTSTYGQEVCHAGGCEHVTPLTYTAPNLFSVSTTIHVSAHLGDIRVYSPAVVIAYETEHSTVFSEFEWGFDNSVDVVAQIYFSTRVQAPLFIEIDSYAAAEFKGTVDLFQFELSELCYGRPGGYELDVHERDEECKQEWLITLVPEFDDCQIETVLDLVFTFDCDPAFVEQRGECPFTRGADSTEVSFSFDYATDNWCELLDIDIQPPVARMESYFSERCDLADDFLVTERAYYEVSIEGNEYLTVTGSELHGLHVWTNCGDDYANAAWFIDAGKHTYQAPSIGLEVVDVPDYTCMYRDAAETVRFSFDLDSDFFHPPKKASCQFEVWAIIELEYLGFGETELLSVELTQDDAGFGNGQPINMGSIKMLGNYSPPVEQLEGSAAMASVSVVTIVALAIAALL